jgi:RNA polymerase primary sigma factor
VTTLLQVANDNVSLSAVIDEEHEFHLSDKLEQDTIPAADFVFLRQSLRRHVQQALGELVEKEEMVLRLRFGLDGPTRKRSRRSAS